MQPLRNNTPSFAAEENRREVRAQSAIEKPRRPVLRYHGGKWRLAPWIISHFPPHDIYVEPFCGAASVLMKKERSHGEVLNDLDDDIFNLFRILRDRKLSQELQRVLKLTLFSRTEFKLSYQVCTDEIERARRTVIRTFMAFGSTGMRKNRSGFRSKIYSDHQTGVTDWKTYADCIPAFTERLQGVLLENMDAFKLIPLHDTKDTLFYLDPPYPFSTRTSLHTGGKWSSYLHELTDADHRKLSRILSGCKGMVIISGYPCDLYDRKLYRRWYRVEREALADGARKRTEVLWINKAARERLRAHTTQLSLIEL